LRGFLMGTTMLSSMPVDPVSDDWEASSITTPLVESESDSECLLRLNLQTQNVLQSPLAALAEGK
jgi:hypothetical protein